MAPTPPVRRAEIAGVLAMAADLGLGQPADQALRSAALAVLLARAMGWPPEVLARAHAVALTRHAACTVLRLVARGRSNKQAAQRLGVSPKTVDNHVQHIYEKIGVSTRSGTTIFAMRNGLLDVIG